MGNEVSFPKSKRSDAEPNLLWALQKEITWEHKLEQETSLLHVAHRERRLTESTSTESLTMKEKDQQLENEHPALLLSALELEHFASTILQFIENLKNDAKEESGANKSPDPELRPIMCQMMEKKAIFLRALLCRIVDAAEFNYQMSILITHLEDRARRESSPMRKAEKDSLLEARRNELQIALGNFDNARAAVSWLQREYSLAFELCEIYLEAEIADKKVHPRVHPEGENLEADARLRKAELASLTSKLDLFKIRINQIVGEAKKLEAQALSIGFRYKDQNFSGSIEPEDMPELSTNLFTRLDLNMSHSISISEFERALRKLKSNIERLDSQMSHCVDEQKKLVEEESQLSGSLTERQQSRRLEEITVKLAQIEEQKKLLQKQRDSEQSILDKICLLFQKGFVRDVFALLPAKVRHHTPPAEHPKLPEHKAISTTPGLESAHNVLPEFKAEEEHKEHKEGLESHEGEPQHTDQAKPEHEEPREELHEEPVSPELTEPKGEGERQSESTKDTDMSSKE